MGIDTYYAGYVSYLLHLEYLLCFESLRKIECGITLNDKEIKSLRWFI